MNLLDLMGAGEDLREKALDRLEGILALYTSDDEDVQDEALARAISLCGKEWGSYKAGLEELAQRKETQAGVDPLEAEMEALRLREEAEDPGAMIRAARARFGEAGRMTGERAAIVARYGSREAAVSPSPIETMFIEATAHLAGGDPATLFEGDNPDDAANDPWAPLAGWSVPWHDIPPALTQALCAACPLPLTIGDARAESLSWEERKRERELLADGPGKAALPTACAARHRLVEEAWRRELPVRSPADFEARLDYWASRGGDDGTGFGVLLLDWRRLGGLVVSPASAETTKEKARRLKAENPTWSLARIGKELGISRQAVHKHLKL
ncbi:MAG TPA: HTH domain-containing protein [Magnetospirillum sp.]|nr:HTH domain-containing protein [Magnetospirillum sp.]